MVDIRAGKIGLLQRARPHTREREPLGLRLLNTMKRPRLLDLFCGAGGAGMGYYRAGFDVVGVDLRPQPRYPFAFVRGDALRPPVRLESFDAIHASPPCQKYSAMTRGLWAHREHSDLVGATRDMLHATGRPYVIENVVGAPLRNPLLLCGTMFGLCTREGSQLRRHRLFEVPSVLVMHPPCQHNEFSAIGVYGGGQHPQRRYGGQQSRRAPVQEGAVFGIEARRHAMGIDWMSYQELSEAIPPAYTEWIGQQLLRAA